MLIFVMLLSCFIHLQRVKCNIFSELDYYDVNEFTIEYFYENCDFTNVTLKLNETKTLCYYIVYILIIDVT